MTAPHLAETFDLATASVSDLTIGEVLGALSHALDLTEGQPPGHCVRCCYIGTRIGEKLGISGDVAADLYYTLLLKDLGCSSNAARICELYLTDDRAFKNGFKTVNGSMREALAFVLKHTAATETLAKRIRTVTDVLKNSDKIITELFQARCQQGSDIARQMMFSEAVAEGIAGLDEHWDGGGRPDGLSGQAIPLASRIALVAQVMDVFFQTSGPARALEELEGRNGSWFDPEVVRAAQDLGRDPGFWETLSDSDLEELVLSAQPARDLLILDDNTLDEIVRGFARVVDAKSPFTNGHSTRVALYTDMLTEELGLPPAARRWMWRSALMHDIGKLGVSNTILDNPKKLTDAEFEIIKRHPLLGERILARVAPFRPMAMIAATHHERLDGKGYPRGLDAGDLTLEMRILTVADIFDALSADRPYRAAMPFAKVKAIMEDMVGTAIDGEVTEALWSAVETNPDLGFT